jgi:hypothetical protein
MLRFEPRSIGSTTNALAYSATLLLRKNVFSIQSSSAVDLYLKKVKNLNLFKTQTSFKKKGLVITGFV